MLSLITVKQKLVIEVSLLYCSLRTHPLFFFLLLCSVVQLNETNVQYHKIVFVHNKNISCYILLHCDSVIILPFRGIMKNNPLERPNKVCKSQRELGHEKLILLHATHISQAFFRLFKKLSPGYLVVITSCNTHVY